MKTTSLLVILSHWTFLNPPIGCFLVRNLGMRPKQPANHLCCFVGSPKLLDVIQRCPNCHRNCFMFFPSLFLENVLKSLVYSVENFVKMNINYYRKISHAVWYHNHARVVFSQHIYYRTFYAWYCVSFHYRCVPPTSITRQTKLPQTVKKNI